MNKPKNIARIILLLFFAINIMPCVDALYAYFTLKSFELPPTSEVRPYTGISVKEWVEAQRGETEAYTQAESTTAASIDFDNLPIEEVVIAVNAMPYDFAELAVTVEPVETEAEPRYILTDAEKKMLCYVADKEDHSSVESRQAVMQVIMNRVESDKFPDTAKEVLYAPKQFQVMRGYRDGYTPSDEAIQALKLLLYGENVFDGEEAIFFAAGKVKKEKIAKNLRLVKTAGGTNFYAQD